MHALERSGYLIGLLSCLGPSVAKRRPSSSLRYLRRDYGQEAAHRHIEEAHALSERLGGMDQEVKRFFFNLDPDHLSEVLERYGQRFGADKRSYAEETFPRWKSGERQMSGLVAGRLFDLLPPIMPFDLKLRIVEGLFENSGKAQTDYVLVPMHSTPTDVVRFVDQTCFTYLSDTGIDPSIKNQFKWLSVQDAEVAEKLFKHAIQVTFNAKKTASEAMMAQLDRDRLTYGDTIKEIISTIRLRRHEVHIKRTSSVEEICTVNLRTFDRGGHEPERTLAERDFSWLWWVGGACLLLWFFAWQ